MNRLLFAFAIVIALFVCAFAYEEDDDSELSRSKRHGGNRKKVCKGWFWYKRCHYVHTCDRYDKATHVCCRPYRNGKCCFSKDLHDKPSCPPKGISYHEDPCNCTKFYQCYNGVLNNFTCPYGGAWNQPTESCVEVTKIPPPFCGTRPYTRQNLPVVYANYNFTAINNKTQPFTKIVSFVATAPRGTVYNVMAYFAGTRTDFSFNTTFSKQFWYNVQCINNVCGNYVVDKSYYIFYLNGKPSNVGVSSVIANDQDMILFSLVKAP